MAKIALGTWAWGAGAFGGDKVFGSKTDVENLEARIRCGHESGAEPVGHGYSLRHGRVGEDSGLAG